MKPCYFIHWDAISTVTQYIRFMLWMKNLIVDKKKSDWFMRSNLPVGVGVGVVTRVYINHNQALEFLSIIQCIYKDRIYTYHPYYTSNSLLTDRNSEAWDQCACLAVLFNIHACLSSRKYHIVHTFPELWLLCGWRGWGWGGGDGV